MTLNTATLRAEADLLLFADAFEIKYNSDVAKRWARATKTLCDVIDACERDVEKLARDNAHMVESIRKLTHACVAKDTDITLLGSAFDATAKELRDADADVARLEHKGREQEEENATLYSRLFEAETRLDAERIGLQVAQQKRAATRGELYKAFADLSDAWFLSPVLDPGTSCRVRDALYKLHVAVYNS